MCNRGDGKKKALLIGAAPLLVKQLSSLSADEISKYDAICCINNVFAKKAKKLYSKYGIAPDYYFFSDWFFTDHPDGGRNVLELKAKKKILCTPPQKQESLRNLNSFIGELFVEGIEECSISTGKTINQLGNYFNQNWATTGMFALGYLLIQEEFDVVDLVGFTFGKGEELHFYEKHNPKNRRHNNDSEESIYTHFNREKKCFSLEVQNNEKE
tara:strand:+ start:497 stop:1135 length:639 start_codon:yes stop_codon:yes gene_type:complete